MLPIPLRVLYVEDEPDVVLLLARELRRAGFAPSGERVESREEFLAHLDPTLDLILSDFTMPGFNGLEALRLMQERNIDLPFIFASGTIGEDVAVAAMQEGAADYLLKDRLTRLGPAVKQALASRRLKEEKLAAEQTAYRLAAIVETSGDAIIAKTLGGIITSWNPAAERLYGYTAKETLGKHISVLFPVGRRRADAPQCFEEVVQRLSAGEHIPAYETVRVRKDGRRIEVLLSISPIRDENGVVTGASAIAHDITERKRAERYLKAEQAVTGILTESKNLEEAGPQVLQTIAECMRWEVAVLWTVDRKANVLRRMHLWHSPSAEARFIAALSQKTVLEPGMGIAGRTWSTGASVREPGIRMDSDPTETSALTCEGLRCGFGLPMRRGTEMVGVIEFYNTELRELDKTLIAALDNVACQISQFCERRQTEASLRASEEHFRNLVMGLPAAVYTTDQAGFITLFNEHAVKLWGRRPALGKDRWGGAKKIFRPDGTPLPLDQSPMAVTLREGRGVRGEEMVIERPDGSRSYVLPHPEPLRDAAGEIVGAVNMLVDLTQMKQLEEQFRQAQKMEAIGRLAGGVAHDFNNLLTVINGYGEIMLSGFKAGDRNRALVQEIIHAGERAAGLTRQLLAFSRQQVLCPQVLNLNAVLADAEKMLLRLIGEDVELKTIKDPALGNVKADAGQVEQVLLNLAVNARDAMPRGGRLTLRTQNVELTAAQQVGHPENVPGQYVLLTVSDNGCGMDISTKSRLFEPFFTTKGTKGTGLGLATVFGIVQQSQGKIDVISAPGQGATFKLYIPRVAEPLSSPKSPSSVPDSLRGSETILLAEDEDGVRLLTRHVLQLNGYTVLEAANGAEAMRIFEKQADTIDLLITDVVMPRMSGRELADQLTLRRPEIKVLYLSGYTDDAVVHYGVYHDQNHFLQKPFNPAGLALKVREVLNAS